MGSLLSLRNRLVPRDTAVSVKLSLYWLNVLPKNGGNSLPAAPANQPAGPGQKGGGPGSLGKRPGPP